MSAIQNLDSRRARRNFKRDFATIAGLERIPVRWNEGELVGWTLLGWIALPAFEDGYALIQISPISTEAYARFIAEVNANQGTNCAESILLGEDYQANAIQVEQDGQIGIVWYYRVEERNSAVFAFVFAVLLIGGAIMAVVIARWWI